MKRSAFLQVLVLVTAVFIGFAGTLLSFRLILGLPDYTTVNQFSKSQLQKSKVKTSKPRAEKKTKKNEKQKEVTVPQNLPLTIIVKQKNLKLSLKNIKIVVDKSDRLLSIYSENILLKNYKIGLGSDPKGPKTAEGDKKTPEGTYYVDQKTDSNLPKRLGSGWIRISYPNNNDALRGLKLKIIDQSIVKAVSEAINKREIPPQESRLGGGVGLHGAGPSPMRDFTRGCVGMTDKDIVELYPYVSINSTVIIQP
jgi:murein L,D-transpeptidase YafK